MPGLLSSQDRLPARGLKHLLKLRRQRDIPAVTEAIAGIIEDWETVQNLASEEMMLDELRGYEGASASRYFTAFGRLITNAGFCFT